MHKRFLLLASLFSMIAVILGAFGAHSLKQWLPAESLSAFETGVRYQFYHSFALFIAGILFQWYPGKWIIWSGYFFITGIILFSGSLYLLAAIKAIGSVGLAGIGILTPLGGLFFISGWLALIAGINSRRI